MANERKDALPSGDTVAREARDLGERAADSAKEMADQQKSAGADRVENVADAMRNTAEQLGSNEEQLAEWVGSAAGQLEGFAQTLREKDLSALMAEMEDFGRRQPAVFMGAAVALGFGIARFAKAGSATTGQGHGTQQSGRQPRWDKDQPQRTTPASTGLGDLPESAQRGPDPVGGLHQANTNAGPSQRPTAGS